MLRTAPQGHRHTALDNKHFSLSFGFANHLQVIFTGRAGSKERRGMLSHCQAGARASLILYNSKISLMIK